MKILVVILSLVIGIFVGGMLNDQGYLASTFISDLTFKSKSSEGASDEVQLTPLYWVAPMDPNFRRDKPGKSPMGMDLIPVYEENQDQDSGPGTVTISPEVENNLGVRTGKVVRRTLSEAIQTVGYVRYNQDSLFNVNPRVEGWVEKLYISAAGDPIRKGQPLYDIYSQDLINAQEELLLALAQTSVRLQKAAARKLRLLHVPEVAIQELLETRRIKENITFYAPTSGVIDNLNVREGHYVSLDKTLLSIAALDQVWVTGEVFEKQAGRVSMGDRVVMTLDYFPGEKWLGRVDHVHPSLDPTTRTLRVRMNFENKNKLLKPNMFANVSIHPEANISALMIPKEAVIRTEDQQRVVLALGNGKFKSVEVVLGRFDQHFIEILEGLTEGERVVTSAQFLLDSESSKSSDFKRMASIEKRSDQPSAPLVEWVQATIESVEMMGGMAMIGVTHKAIDAWGWPDMYMDFPVVSSVDVASLSIGQSLQIEITKYPDNRYEISDVAPRVDKRDGSAKQSFSDRSNHEDH